METIEKERGIEKIKVYYKSLFTPLIYKMTNLSEIISVWNISSLLVDGFEKHIDMFFKKTPSMKNLTECFFCYYGRWIY